MTIASALFKGRILENGGTALNAVLEEAPLEFGFPNISDHIQNSKVHSEI